MRAPWPVIRSVACPPSPATTEVAPSIATAASPNSSSSMPSSDAGPGGEVAAAGQAHRLPAGGPVEGLGDRGPPVDDDRVAVLVGDRHPADVEGVAAPGGPLDEGMSRRFGLGVDATEDERRLAELELLEPVGDGVPDDVALEAGLLGAAAADLDHVSSRVALGRDASRQA